MHGTGFYKYKDGKRYRGQFYKDKKEGFGIYHWQDGRVYEGYWLKGKQHGLGKYIVPENQGKFGLWEEGKRVEWFSEEQVQIINSHQLDYRTSYKNPAFSVETLRSFTRPLGFEQSLIAIKNDVTESLTKTNPMKGNSYYFFNESSRMSDILNGDPYLPSNSGPGGMDRDLQGITRRPDSDAYFKN